LAWLSTPSSKEQSIEQSFTRQVKSQLTVTSVWSDAYGVHHWELRVSMLESVFDDDNTAAEQLWGGEMMK